MGRKMLVHIQFKLSVGFYLIITEKHTQTCRDVRLAAKLQAFRSDGTKIVRRRGTAGTRPCAIKSSLHFCHIQSNQFFFVFVFYKEYEFYGWSAAAIWSCVAKYVS